MQSLLRKGMLAYSYQAQLSVAESAAFICRAFAICETPFDSLGSRQLVKL